MDSSVIKSIFDDAHISQVSLIQFKNATSHLPYAHWGQYDGHKIGLLISIANSFSFTGERAGGRLNKKDGLTWYGNSHVKDKTS